MKKFNKLVCAGVLAFVGLFGVCNIGHAFDPNNTMYNQTVSQTNWSNFSSYLILKDYTQGVGAEDFTGSSTTNGGTSTFSSGLTNVRHITGNIFVSWYGSPTASGGSSTVRIYGVFGTTTAGAGTGGAVMLINPYASPVSSTVATGTVFTITQHPDMIGVSVEGLSGTMTHTVGISSNATR